MSWTVPAPSISAASLLTTDNEKNKQSFYEIILSIGRGCEALERDLRALEATKLSINFKESIREFFLALLFHAHIIFAPTVEEILGFVDQNLLPREMLPTIEEAQRVNDLLVADVRIQIRKSIKEKLLSTVPRVEVGDEIPVRPPREILVEMIFQKAWEDKKTRCQKDNRDMTEEDLKRVMESFSGLEIFREIPPEYAFEVDTNNLGYDFSDGLHRMFHVCVGNTDELRHCHAGATAPEWSKFTAFKQFCTDARKARFGDYAKKISDMDCILRKFEAEEENEARKKIKEWEEKRRKPFPKKDRRVEMRDAKAKAIERMRGHETYEDKGEFGQAYQGNDFTPRLKCFACEGTFPYHECLSPSEEEYKLNLMNEVGKNAPTKYKCAEAATSRKCNNLS